MSEQRNIGAFFCGPVAPKTYTTKEDIAVVKRITDALLKSDNTARNPKRRGMYIVRTNTGQEVTIGKWDGKDWSLWCEMWDPPEWDPAYCLNCAVTAWAHPGHMDGSNFIPAKPPRKIFTKRKP